MANLEMFLLEDSIQLFEQAERENKTPEAYLLEDDALMKELGTIYRDHETALRKLVVAMNADLVRHMVQRATPIETVGIRHELQGAEKLFTRLAKYAGVAERLLLESEKEAQEKSQKEEGVEVPDKPPKEGEEGSL